MRLLSPGIQATEGRHVGGVQRTTIYKARSPGRMLTYSFTWMTEREGSGSDSQAGRLRETALGVQSSVDSSAGCLLPLPARKGHSV